MGTRRVAPLLVGLAMVASGAAPDGLEAQDRTIVEEQAVSVVEHAADLMGGVDRLRSIHRVSMEMTTTWLRTAFRDVPFTDRPSYEEHTDTRDYEIGAWRNTRIFPNGSITNIVRDSISVTDMGRGFQPLSDAYVDERLELFTYTPDRLVVALLDARRLVMGADTTLGGEPHHRVEATLASEHGHVSDVEVFFHAGTRLPTMLRFTAPHPSDFGLVQWGAMAVEVWYSAWGSFGDVHIPRQWDIRRVGVPYKRLTVRRAAFDPVFEADSFAVSDSLRVAYHRSPAARPMHEGRPIDSVSVPSTGLALFSPPFGYPTGAVSTTAGTVLLGAGRAPFNFDAALDELDRIGLDLPSMVLAIQASPGNGGIVGATRMGVPILVSPASLPFARAVLDNHGLASARLSEVRELREVGSGDERIVLAPVDLPDTPGALMLHHPTSGWLWVPDAATPLDLRIATEAAATLGWSVRARGWARAPWDVVEGGPD